MSRCNGNSEEARKPFNSPWVQKRKKAPEFDFEEEDQETEENPRPKKLEKIDLDAVIDIMSNNIKLILEKIGAMEENSYLFVVKKKQ